jgi:hypothetical protein
MDFPVMCFILRKHNLKKTTTLRYTCYCVHLIMFTFILENTAKVWTVVYHIVCSWYINWLINPTYLYCAVMD